MAGESNVVQSFSSSSTSNLQKPAESPASRKLGKHGNKQVKSYADAPHLSPSEAPTIKAKLHLHYNKANTQNSESVQEIHMKKPQEHGSGDKSIAGGGVILGGLATTFLIAIFLYIRATRRNSANPQPGTP